MTEERIFFESDGLQLEGLLDAQPGEKAVVITHPHPLYGGEMHNDVVGAISAAYIKAFHTTLRFNFRGVGASEGEYNEGMGEQADVNAALTFLRERGKCTVALAGYSFGAWVIAMGLTRYAETRQVIMVSPPVSFVDFSFLEYSSKISLVIAGSHDDIGPADMIRTMVTKWNPEAEFKIIEGADHFYWGKTGELRIMIEDFLENKESNKGVES